MAGPDPTSLEPAAMADHGPDSLEAAAMADPDITSLQAATEVPTTASLGPMGPLLRKLADPEQQHLPPDETRLLKVLCISLKNMSEDEDASFLVQWWMMIVRELCYDMDDHLDEVIDGGRPQHDISHLLTCVKDAIEKRKLFQWSPKTIKPDSEEAGIGRLMSQASHSSKVGVVEPPKRLVEMMALDDHGEKTLKVIPIHGCAGVGKTTVARALYHKHAGKFQCRAFVSVSRHPDMRGFLSSMLAQLRAPRPLGFPDVPDLIDAIKKHLEGKRYFILIDDLWTASVWNVISRAFPRGDCCSRIITTTRVDDVALACCCYYSEYIYKMEPLNDNESRELFFGTVFGSEKDCPRGIKEVSYDIIKKCGGLPLAIVCISSLLAGESSIACEKWKHIQGSLPSTSEGLKAVLNLVYNSLPPRLRTCLLYLSIYPQGCVTKKDELVKHWVAEDFLCAVEGRDKEEIAEGYFSELVSRGMVQAVDTNNNGEVLSFTVHQLVLDFIRYKSKEENFVITVGSFQSTLALSQKVRRLSIQFGGVKSAYIPENFITSHVRSLIFWGFFKCVPSITDYGLLQVLVLHVWADQDGNNFDLTGIGKLFRLKYLKIECNITVELPGEIGRLHNLGTLHVDARLSAIPSDIVYLRLLHHLRLPSGSILPQEVAHMTSLRTLGYFDLSSHSGEDVLHLESLTNLQDLQLTCSTVQPAENLEKNVQLLGSVLEKLPVLQSVTLVPASGSTCDASINIPCEGFSMVSPPSDLLLRRIEISRRCCIFSSLPKWFGELSKLGILKIAIMGLSGEDIDLLKGLSPSLTALTLYILTAPAERILIKDGDFPVLTYLKFICDAPCLSFEEGAMKKVQKLKLGFNAGKMEQDTFEVFGFRHLKTITEITVKFGARSADEFDMKDAESTLEAAVSNGENTPVIRVQCVDVIFHSEEGTSVVAEEEDMDLEKEIRDGKKKKYDGLEEHVNKQSVDSGSTSVREPNPEGVKGPIEDVADSSMFELISDLPSSKTPNFSAVLGRKQEKRQDSTSQISIAQRLGIQKASVDEIQNSNKKKKYYGLEEHVNKQYVDSGYARADNISLPGSQLVDLLTGAMGPLLPKLRHLLEDKHNLLGDSRDDVESIIRNLGLIRGKLLDMVAFQWDRQDDYCIRWAERVRDITYYAEDIVDSFLMCVEGSGHHSKQKGIGPIIRRAVRLLKGQPMKQQGDSVAIRELCTLSKKKIRELSYQIHEILARMPHCAVADPVATSTSSSPLSDPHEDLSHIVGIEISTEEVIRKLRMKDDNTRLDIVSIVGMAGLGKTTLAKAVYQWAESQFYCRAFVNVSRHPNMDLVFKHILVQIDKKRYKNIDAVTLNGSLLIEELRGLLADRRFFLVIDDICDGQSWEKIKSALTYSKSGSKVITTSRILTISAKESEVYMLNPLSAEHSEELFSKLLLVSYIFQNVPREILQQCHGLPLAITTIANLFNGHKEWIEVPRLLHNRCTYYTDEPLNMRNILVSSYYDLPYHLRTCVLYLHIFPTHRPINKKTLIWKWIAEGFITEELGTGLYKLGEGYFNELVDRSLIMPIQDKRRGSIVGCLVHNVVHELICSLSTEENFVTILDNKQHTNSEGNARRLAIQNKDVESYDPLGSTQIRSFNTTMCHFSMALSLSRFKVLRVLAIEDCTFTHGRPYQLEHIGMLIHLRYLGLYNTHISELPRDVGNLTFLQTLDMRGTGVRILPHDVSQLSRLMCLRADDVSTRVPDWIGELTSLEELQLGSVGRSVKFVKELGKLTELRELEIVIERFDENSNKALVESMGNLKKIQVLALLSSEPGVEANWAGFVPPGQLRDLRMKIASSRLPAWINSSRVPNLSHLSVEVKAVKEEDLDILGALPELFSMELLMPSHVFLDIKGGAFPSLRYFGASAPVRFLPGAMPCLECFHLEVDEPTRPDDFDFSTLGNLLLLQKLEVKISSTGGFDIRAVHEAFEHAVKKHPNSPKLFWT